jgi:hypothetical protein
LSDFRLTISDHVDAPRLARVFTRGVIEEIETSDDAKTAIILMVSDAATDSVRSGHSITITAEQTDDGYRIVLEGSELAPPVVTAMPKGLTVEAGDHVLTIRIGHE